MTSPAQTQSPNLSMAAVTSPENAFPQISTQSTSKRSSQNSIIESIRSATSTELAYERDQAREEWGRAKKLIQKMVELIQDYQQREEELRREEDLKREGGDRWWMTGQE